MQCPNCGSLLSERGYFCKACGSQAKCLACRELLEPEAVACVECGVRVGEKPDQLASVAAASPTSVALAPNRNTLSYREDKNSRVCEASLTDQAMQGLGDVFGELFVQRGATRTASLRRHLTDDGTLIDGQKSLPAGQQPPQEAPPPPSPSTLNRSTANPASPDSQRIHSILVPNGETFEVADNRVKAKNYSDYTRRMTYLYLYAHECSGRTSALDTDLRAFLKSAKAMDGSGNAARWLAKHVGYSKDGDDRVKLNVKGREEAKKALSDALDPNVPDAWNPDSHQPRKRGKNKKA
jgi:hypothetical protein